MTDSIQQPIFEIIAKQAKVDVATIKPESTLKDLGIASLDAIELIFDIEEHFDINFPDQQGANFDSDTAQSMVDAVRRALDEKALEQKAGNGEGNA
ncbi:MAG: phosphopantetheine-binding protein [Rhodanobacter sp.]